MKTIQTKKVMAIVSKDELDLIKSSTHIQVSNFFWNGEYMDWDIIPTRDIVLYQNGAEIPIKKNRHNKYQVHGIKRIGE